VPSQSSDDGVAIVGALALLLLALTLLVTTRRHVGTGLHR
jgi:hypothetical protein